VILFRASDTYDYFRPSACALRVFLRSRGVPEAPASPFDELLRSLGLRHEAAHLAVLPGAVDLRGLPQDVRERRTVEELRAGAAAIYQPRLRAHVSLDGDPCEVVGEPDFLVRAERGTIVRDAKLARRVGGADHREITLQLQIYGWLFERATGLSPARLEVLSGAGELVRIPQDRGAAMGFLRWLKSIRQRPEEFYEPVGWSKCGGCGFQGRCWPRAVASRDPAILMEVGQNVARALRSSGVRSIEHLAAYPDEVSLGRAVPGAAERRTKILRSARAMAGGTHEVLERIDLPAPEDCVSFDLEGLPPYAEGSDRVYLWGMKAWAQDGPLHLPILAGFAPRGDQEGWEEFLRVAAALLAGRPSRRFVHWGVYEKSRIGAYVERYGDCEGAASHVLASLFDLHRALKRAVVLPVPSYSLKTVEAYVGFRRRMPEARGDWAIARFIQAVETTDPALRDTIVGEIVAYNEEDLDATRTVLEWLRGVGPQRPRSEPGGGGAAPSDP